MSYNAAKEARSRGFRSTSIAFFFTADAESTAPPVALQKTAWWPSCAMQVDYDSTVIGPQSGRAVVIKGSDLFVAALESDLTNIVSGAL